MSVRLSLRTVKGSLRSKPWCTKILPSRFACRLAFAPTYTRTPALNRCAGREVRVGGEVTDAQNTITRVSTTRPPNSRRSEDLLGSANRAHPVGWLFVILLFPFVLLFISLSLSFTFTTSLGRPRESDSLHVPRSLHFARACELRKTEAVQLSSVLLRWGRVRGRRWFPFPGRPLSIRPTMGGPYFPDNTSATPSSGTVDVNTGN